MILATWKEDTLFRKKEPYLWESAWIDYLCSRMPSVRRSGTADMPPGEPLALIISDNGNDAGKSEKIVSFLEKESRKRPTGVFHLSDEWYTAPFRELYEHAAFVVRVGHWAQKFPEKVLTVPIGLSSEFIRTSAEQGLTNAVPASRRTLTWSFVGQVHDKKHRLSMLERLSVIKKNYIYLGTTDWSKPSSGLPKSEYARTLSQSIFAPCPRGMPAQGYGSVDGFRTWEAADCGAIPIVDTLYYRDAFGAPFPVVSPDWSDVVDFVEKVIADPARLDALQREISGWWRNCKQDLPARVARHLSLPASES